MSQTVSVWLLVLSALALANLPFLHQRLLLVGPSRASKSLAWRLLELALLYLIVGGLGRVLEQRLGRLAEQGWEFYAITGTLFVTLAFPGFVYRYLLHHRT